MNQEEINGRIRKLTSQCWDIANGLKTFALDLDGSRRE